MSHFLEIHFLKCRILLYNIILFPLIPLMDPEIFMFLDCVAIAELKKKTAGEQLSDQSVIKR